MPTGPFQFVWLGVADACKAPYRAKPYISVKMRPLTPTYCDSVRTYTPRPA